jgi:hypothetical protein
VKRLVWAAGLALGIWIAGCDMEPHAPAAAAIADVWIATPRAGDQAFVIRFDAPVVGFSPASGIRHFEAADARAATMIVVADRPLPGGEVRIGSVRVEAGAGPVAGAVTEAADASRRVQETLDGYAVRLTPR